MAKKKVVTKTGPDGCGDGITFGLAISQIVDGEHVGVTSEIFTTQFGELSLSADQQVELQEYWEQAGGALEILLLDRIDKTFQRMARRSEKTEECAVEEVGGNPASFPGTPKITPAEDWSSPITYETIFASCPAADRNEVTRAITLFPNLDKKFSEFPDADADDLWTYFFGHLKSTFSLYVTDATKACVKACYGLKGLSAVPDVSRGGEIRPASGHSSGQAGARMPENARVSNSVGGISGDQDKAPGADGDSQTAE